MKKILICLLFILLTWTTYTYANESITTINLSLEEITVNNSDISKETTSSVYISNRTNNGGISKEAKEANIEIDNIINITKEGNYEISGTLENCQISINANKITGQVKLILNNANITCDNAPAILIYNKKEENEDCKVIISTAEGTKNSITGSRMKENLLKWNEIEELDYYIRKGTELVTDEEYVEYKYNGAISSDVVLEFEGKGSLDVYSYKKEGIECRKNIIFNSGNYNITAMDDAVNTIKEDGDIIVNGGRIITNVFKEAEEGDGIDSNAGIQVNGGVIYAFSYAKIENGLDSHSGVHIQGGQIFSIGYNGGEKYYIQKGKLIQEKYKTPIKAGTKIVVVDENEQPIFAFKTDRAIKTFAYSSEDLNFETYKVYVGDEIPENLSYSYIDLCANKDNRFDIEDFQYTKYKPNSRSRVAVMFITIVIVIIIALACIKIFLKQTFKKK